MSVADLKSLPNLPGFTYPEMKERYHKPQTWNVVNNQRIEQKEGLSHDKPKFVKMMKPQDQWRKGSLPDSTTRHVFKQEAQPHHELPAWDALDRHVLRFYGFFKEAVVETNLENFRVRKVIVYYFLEDDTCQIIEPRQDNSGIPQGQLIRRHRFPATGGGYMGWDSLRVGEELALYGRVIMINDCDEFTRSYYQQAGMEQPDAFAPDSDPFLATREAIKAPDARQPRTYEKIYREVMLGGGHINADMQQFLENDRKVLRFFSIMDDVSTPQFERRPFEILFFLADDQVEIREKYPLNCGRDNFPIFFRKAKMPIGVYTVAGPQSQPRKKSDYVHGHDFAVGMNVTLLGNYHFFIYDADDFTRAYFRDELGCELEPKQEVQLPERAVPRAATPPYTGYGSWDDSMSSVTHLIPKAPKKDFNKLFQHEGKVLRFKARFASPKPEDVDRIFVLSFHLQDDCLSIHEPPQRNLGIVTGRFLEKGIHLNQETGQLFKAEDFLPGNTVTVYNNSFEIIDMDEYTHKTFADPNAKHRKFELESVLQKIRESLRQQYPLVRDVFRKFDTSHSGVLTLEDVKKALEKFGFQLEERDVLVIMSHFDSTGSGQISYNEFCDCILDEDWTDTMLKTKPALKHNVHPSYAEHARTKIVERAETEEVRKAVRALGDAFLKTDKIQTRFLKECGHLTHHNTISCQGIQQALAVLGMTFELEDIHRAVLFLEPDADLERVNQAQFVRDMRAAFHDMAQRPR